MDGLCKTALSQSLIRCSCWRSERVRKQRGRDGETHMFTFIALISSIKYFLYCIFQNLDNDLRSRV